MKNRKPQIGDLCKIDSQNHPAYKNAKGCLFQVIAESSDGSCPTVVVKLVAGVPGTDEYVIGYADSHAAVFEIEPKMAIAKSALRTLTPLELLATAADEEE